MNKEKLIMDFLELNNWLGLENEENARGVVRISLERINDGCDGGCHYHCSEGGTKEDECIVTSPTPPQEHQQ